MGSAALSRRAFLRRAAFAGSAVLTARWIAPESGTRLETQTTAYSSAALVGPARRELLPPPIITRSEWGANEALRHTRPFFGDLNAIVVHHTTTDPTDDPSADAREVYRLHLKRDDGRWGDIGYHFLIHPNGHVYEGRRARDYVDGEVHDGHDVDGGFLQGIHARGANRATAGIALIGDYRKLRPTVPALAALTRVSAWLCDQHEIDPLANGSIIGHLDASATACPGDTTYELLPDLRQWVAGHLPQPVDTTVTPGAIGTVA